MTSFIDRHFRPLMLLLVAIGFVAVGLAMAQGQIDSDSTDETECKWIVKPTKQPNYAPRYERNGTVSPFVSAPAHAVQYNECTGIAYGLIREANPEYDALWTPEKIDYQVDRNRAYGSVPRSPDCKWNVVATEFSQPFRGEKIDSAIAAHAILYNECTSIAFNLEALYYEYWPEGEQWFMYAFDYGRPTVLTSQAATSLIEQYEQYR